MTEIKIDQLKKFLSNFAYNKPKVEKKIELTELTYKKAQSATTGVCGRKTSNICVILFFNGKGQGLLDQYVPLVEQFKNDPITWTYI